MRHCLKVLDEDEIVSAWIQVQENWISLPLSLKYR